MVEPDPGRNAAIHAERQAGAALAEIGARHLISPERVKQIVRAVERSLRHRLSVSLTEAGALPPDAPLRDLPLSGALVREMEGRGAATVGKAARFSDEEILSWPYVGRARLREFRRFVRHVPEPEERQP